MMMMEYGQQGQGQGGTGKHGQQQHHWLAGGIEGCEPATALPWMHPTAYEFMSLMMQPQAGSSSTCSKSHVGVIWRLMAWQMQL